MEQLYRSGKLHLRDSGVVGINEMLGKDGKIYSASNLGPSLWYYPIFLMGKTFNSVAKLPMDLRPRCNFVGIIDQNDFANPGKGDWAPVFARLSNALLFGLSFLLLTMIAPLSAWRGRLARLYPWAVLFGTQSLLIGHSNYDHTLNGFGLLMAVAGGAMASRNQWQIRWLIFSGLGLAISLTTRQFSLVYVPLMLMWLIKELGAAKRWIRILVPLVPVIAGILINMAYNYLRTGYYFSTGYDKKWIQFHPILRGVELYFGSGVQSVLLYSPVLLLGALGVKLFIRRMQSFSILLSAIFVIQFVFYLKWFYGGGALGPLRFMSEIFFICVFFIPVGRVRWVGTAVLLTSAWSYSLTLFLSFYDLRRIADPAQSFGTWKSPSGKSSLPGISSEFFQYCQEIFYLIKMGYPDWFGYLIGGKHSLTISSLVLGLIGVGIILTVRRSLRVYYLVTLCPSLALLIGGALACPKGVKSNYSLATPTCEMRELTLFERNGFLVFSGKLNLKQAGLKYYYLKLQHLEWEFVTTDYFGPFTFGAQFYKSNTLGSSGETKEFANFQEFIRFGPMVPPGRYVASVSVDDVLTTLPFNFPDRIPYVNTVTFLDFSQWCRSAGFDNSLKLPLLKEGSSAYLSFHLPVNPVALCDGRLFISNAENTEVSSNLDSLKVTVESNEEVSLQFIPPVDGTAIVIKVQANSTSNTLTGLLLKPGA